MNKEIYTGTEETSVEKLKCGIELPELKDIIDEQEIEREREELLSLMIDRILTAQISFLDGVIDAGTSMLGGDAVGVASAAEKAIKGVAEEGLGEETVRGVEGAVATYNRLVSKPLLDKWEELLRVAVDAPRESAEEDMTAYQTELREDTATIQDWYEKARAEADKIWEERFGSVPNEAASIIREAIEAASEKNRG